MREQDIKIFRERGCTLITNPDEANTNTRVTYICACSVEMVKRVKDFTKSKGCRSCNSKRLQFKPVEQEEMNDEVTGEIWKPVEGGYISSLGNAKNANGKELKLSLPKLRYRMNGKHQYASRLMAVGFELPNYQNLNTQNYVVSFKKLVGEKVSKEDLFIDNLHVVPKSGQRRCNPIFTSERYTLTSSWNKNQFRYFESRTIPNLPKKYENFRVYSNGEIWNGEKWLTFSKGDYYNVNLGRKYKVHRIVCFVFHPIKGKNCIEDYDDLQVNHKNGNTFDNSVENLEWCTQSENISHAYKNNLNSNTHKVIQLEKDGKFIGAYTSIAEASRQTGESEHCIRYRVKDLPIATNKYDWKTLENTGKFDRKTKRVVQLDMDRKFIQVFPSLSEASKQTGETLHCISNSVNGKVLSTNRYIWKYLFEEKKDKEKKEKKDKEKKGKISL